MAKDDDESTNIIPFSPASEHESSGNNRKHSWKDFIDVKSIVSGLLCPAIIAIFVFGMKLYEIPGDLSLIKTDISNIKGDISDITDEIKRIDQKIDAETNNRITSDTQIQTQIMNLALSPALRPTNACSKEITTRYNSWGSPYQSSSNPLTATTLVAYNKDTNEQYRAEQIAEQSLLLPYMSDDQEVYFYGQFSESGQWDGNCITNVYKNNKLMLITDAVYDNGKLQQCKQVFSYTLKSGQDVWAFADRMQEEGFSSGVTWLYERTAANEYIKDFTFDTVTVGHIFTAEKYREGISDHLCAFYHGNTADGFFNDTTGSAYMVYFFADGTVRLLYSGNFKDGTFNDNTGNAWYIVKDTNTAYMYVKGPFKDGHPIMSRAVDKGYPPLAFEDIQGYMSQREFDFPFDLKWFGFDLI